MRDLLDQQERIARFRERREAEAVETEREQSARSDVIAAWWSLERGEPLTPEQTEAVREYLRAKFAKHEKQGRDIAACVQRLVDLGLSPDGSPSALELVADRYSVSVSKVRRAWCDWRATLQKT